MQAIPLGLVTVATAGTPVTVASLLTAAQLEKIPPSGLVAKIDVWPNPAAENTGYVKVQSPDMASPAIVAAIPTAATETQHPWHAGFCDRNTIPYAQFSLDVAESGDGAGFVTLWVE
jgi:hypothetical protein